MRKTTEINKVFKMVKIKSIINNYPGILKYWDIIKNCNTSILKFYNKENPIYTLINYSNVNPTIRWPELESELIKNRNPQELYNYHNGHLCVLKRWAEAEPIFKTSSEYLYWYCVSLFNGRWDKDLEDAFIATKDIRRVFQYAIKFNIKSKEIEDLMLTNEKYAYRYTFQVQ